MNTLDQLAETLKDHAESDERNLGEIKVDLKEIKVGLKTWNDTYDGVLFTKKVLIGTAGFLLAIAAIGGAMMWVVDWIRNKP